MWDVTDTIKKVNWKYVKILYKFLNYTWSVNKQKSKAKREGGGG